MIDFDEAKVERSPFRLWLGWTLATAAGLLAGYLPLVPLAAYLELWQARLLFPLWAGFLVGLLQWLVLRRYLTHSASWIVHGGVGWALGYALGLFFIRALSGSFVGVLLGYLLFGLVIAAVQWPVLRREIPNIIPWAAANVVGWAAGAYLGQRVLGLLARGGTVRQWLSTLVISGMTGLVAGAITAVALILIVRRPDLPRAGEGQV